MMSPPISWAEGSFFTCIMRQLMKNYVTEENRSEQNATLIKLKETYDKTTLPGQIVSKNL